MALLPLVMDGLVLLFLGVTVFFAARLSVQLRVFRETRNDLRNLIGDLSGQINQAEMAITGLRESARESGRDLQEMVSEANAIKDELEMLYDASDRLATRLENVPSRRKVERSKPLPASPVRESSPPTEFSSNSDDGNIPAERTQQSSDTEKRPAQNGASFFAIRDPEFDHAGDSDDGGDVSEEVEPGDFEDELDAFQSRAEKELFEALRGKKKVESAGDV